MYKGSTKLEILNDIFEENGITQDHIIFHDGLIREIKKNADVHFCGKGNKHRVIPLSRVIWNQYDRYCVKKRMFPPACFGILMEMCAESCLNV